MLKRLKDRLTIPISVDTYKAEVAERALDLGAEIINDPSGLTFEPNLARIVSNHDAGLVVNHMRGRPETWAKLGPLKDAMAAIRRDLEASVSRARLVGIDKSRIAVDPGLGFGKRGEQNSLILGKLRELADLDLAIMIGPSRKHFLAHDTPRKRHPPAQPPWPPASSPGLTSCACMTCPEMRAAADVADEILKACAQS